MITIVGVGHVFDISGQVKDVIFKRQPEIVGVELDRTRYWGLIHRHTREDAGILYRALAHFQRRIAHQYGVEVGDEMLAAVRAAGEIGAQLAFLDMDSAEVLSRLWSQMKFEEKIKLAVSTIASLFVGKKQVERELNKFSRDSNSYMQEFAEHFPSVKKILIDDRNRYIANSLRNLSLKYNRIVAVVNQTSRTYNWNDCF